MPNVTIFVPAEAVWPDETLVELTERCTELCTGILNAALDNVHIIFVTVPPGRGHPVFAEIKYRLESFRTQSVMDLFMEQLDEAIKHQTGLTARIRCFGYAAPNIHARN